MKKQFLFLVVLMFFVSCGNIKKHNEQITKLHTVESLRSDVDKVYNQLKKHHPKLYEYTSKEILDFKFDSLKKAITIAIPSREFYKKLAPVVAQIKQGHISVGSVSKRFTKKEKKALMKRKFEFYDLEFEYLDNKLWVVGTKGNDSTVIGNEVFKIEGDTATNLVQLYKSLFSSDGYNQTLYNRAVGNHFSTYYYKDKGFLDSLDIEFKQKDSLFTKTFRRILKAEKSKNNDSIAPIIPLKMSKEEKRQNRLAAKKKRKENRKRGFIEAKKEYTRNFDFIGKDSVVAYMKMRSFTNGNYKKFYKESFKKLDSLKTEHLILDLRDNGGGRIAEIDYLYSFLTNKNYKLVEESEVNSRLPYFKSLMSNTTPFIVKASTVVLSPFIIAQNLMKTNKSDGKIYYKFRFSKEKEPKELNYKGLLYVITNGNSFSASSLLSTHLKANKRAVFVGEETGGAYNGCVAGIYKIYEMPNSKLNIRIGLMQIEAPYKQIPNGYGIIPDVAIVPTIEDRKQHKDPELDWILNDIKTNK
ncbi:S41 family peptidase [Mariniflexile litorale]|uniref:S41 family peptidase n=1 Tax=Mariniflexile litorale TaxID=3045158 RepID=A0AAU7EEI8_9FLAO|nr:S41 family peptidase [Mariniflexile sp. KMM 9835]MDQ8211592.1 S41 family peptidase [Mariniflexile sp. KMM 9835]